MLARTQAHLAKAEHHRRIAQALVNPAAHGIPPPLPLDWTVVAAFYAAVHCANAWFWERWQHDPGGHPARSNAVWLSTELRPAAVSYAVLQDLGWQARYEPFYVPDPVAITDAVANDVEGVRRAAYQALGLTP